MNERRSIETYADLGGWYDQKYEEMKGTWSTPIEECERHLNDLGVPKDRPDLRLLDIGCGGGHFLAQAARRVSCIGIEVSRLALEYAKERLRDTGLPARLALSNIEDLQTDDPNGVFDYICSIGSLEHVLDIDKALWSIRKLLKPTGKFYFYLPNEKWIHQDQPNERTATQAGWLMLLSEHGFEVESIKRWNDSDAYTGTAIQDFEFAEVAGPAVESILQFQHKDLFETIYGRFLSTPPLYINLGSGQRPFAKPWVNVDIQAKWKPDIVADGGDLRAHFADNTADIIVLQHTLEHYGCGEAKSMLMECHRILKTGGRMVVTVPNMAELCEAYLRYLGKIVGGAYGTGAKRWMSTQLFLTNLYGAYNGDEADRHKWGFDADSLRRTLLDAAPWSKIEPMSKFIEAPNADVSMDWWILGMEAIK